MRRRRERHMFVVTAQRCFGDAFETRVSLRVVGVYATRFDATVAAIKYEIDAQSHYESEAVAKISASYYRLYHDVLKLQPAGLDEFVRRWMDLRRDRGTAAAIEDCRVTRDEEDEVVWGWRCDVYETTSSPGETARLLRYPPPPPSPPRSPQLPPSDPPKGRTTSETRQRKDKKPVKRDRRDETRARRGRRSKA